MQGIRQRLQGRFRIGLIALLTTAVMLAAGCAPQAPAQQPAAQPQQAAPAQAAPAQPAEQPAEQKPALPAKPAQNYKVKIGSLKIATNAAFFAAQENGHFEKLGIDAEFITLESASTATIPLGTGEIHVVGGSLSGGLFNAIGKGVEIEVVADKGKMSIVNGEDLSSMRLSIRKDLWDQGIRDVKDLKGKTIGINAKGSGSEFQLTQILKQAGLTINDITLAQLGFPNMPAAMENKSIDAGMMLEPFASIARNQGFSEWLTSTAAAYNHYQSGVILYSGKWAKENPEAANRFMAAYLLGQRDYETARRLGPGTPEYDRMAEFISKYTGQSPEQIKAVTWAYLDPSGRLNVQSVQDELEWNIQTGVVKDAPDLNKVVNTSYVDYANQVLGDYVPPKQ